MKRIYSCTYQLWLLYLISSKTCPWCGYLSVLFLTKDRKWLTLDILEVFICVWFGEDHMLLFILLSILGVFREASRKNWTHTHCDPASLLWMKEPGISIHCSTVKVCSRSTLGCLTVNQCRIGDSSCFTVRDHMRIRMDHMRIYPPKLYIF